MDREKERTPDRISHIENGLGNKVRVKLERQPLFDMQSVKDLH